MDIEVLRERFDEFLKVLAGSGLPSATRRVLWLAVLDALDKAVADERVPRGFGANSRVGKNPGGHHQSPAPL